jgi:hypothetical protein
VQHIGARRREAPLKRVECAAQAKARAANHLQIHEVLASAT